MEIALYLGGVILLVATVFAFSAWRDRKRRDAIEKVAGDIGLEFFPDGSEELQSQMSALSLFNAGRSRKLTKLIRGESDEVSISIFDYRYVTGRGKHSQTHTQTIAALISGRLNTPNFSIRPETMLDKIGGMIGFKDINFDTHPNFSSMFVLKGSDENQVREFFKPEILTFFETHKGISVEAIRGHLIIYRPGKTVPPGEIKNLLATAYEVYGTFVDN